MPASKQFGLCNSIDLEGSPNELRGDVAFKIREQLDTNPEDSDWRALIRVSEEKYRIRPEVRESWSSAINNGRSAADCLLTELSSMGMTVHELCGYLDKLHIDTCKLGLMPYQDIGIMKDVPGDVEVYEDGSLHLEVGATGRPFPCYQWFFCRDGQNNFTRLAGHMESHLRMDKVSMDNAGAYTCQIHNCNDGNKCRFSKKCLVSVVPDPHPPDPGLDPPEKPDISAMLSDLVLGIGEVPPDCGFDGLGTGYKPPVELPFESSSLMGSLIVQHPHDLTVGVNEPFVLSVETRGDPPIVYQWYRNGLPIPEYTSKLQVHHAMPNDFGSYECLVKDGRTTQMSRKAYVREYALKPFAPNDEIIIVSNPKSCTVKFGGDAMFHCEAKCPKPLRYQWFKDGILQEGESGSELKFYNIQDRRWEGMYQCEVSTMVPTCKRRLTFGARLTVQVPQDVRENIEYNPSDKVALLIGNYDYRSEQPLTAPIADVQVLQEIFRSLEFKVVSLLNLTKPEIESAVLEFCKLVDKNVYVVFYFCGHGFEEEGYSFLVPTDAPTGYKTDECVCADIILENIQKKEPPLIFMIIDICRKRNKVKGTGVPLYLDRQPRGNTVFCYATSIGMNAYEDRNNGLLVGHLQGLLTKPIGIDALVSELKEEFNRIPHHSERQNPELRSNLREPRRSLVDKVAAKGQAEAFQQRTRIWMNSQLKPEKRDIDIPKLGVRVELDFTAFFSNVLHVYAIVKKKGITETCIPYISHWPASVSIMCRPMLLTQDPCKTKVTLQDIQKLQSNLVVNLLVRYNIGGQPEDKLFIEVDLGMPLVAKLHLWREQPNFTPMHREGMEQTEDSGDYSLGT